MKFFFFIAFLWITLTKALTDLAEKRKRYNFIIKLLKEKRPRLPTYHDYDKEGNLVLKPQIEFGGEYACLFIPMKAMFTDCKSFL